MNNTNATPAEITNSMACVIYGAKSTADVRGSIQTQLDDCRLAVAREGGVVVDEFTDENKSAWSSNRGDGLSAAKACAVALASEHGEAQLWVQHSDRLARGDGLKADHLAEIFFAMRKLNVTLRSVDDNNNLGDPLRAVLIGERNSEDSERKAHAVRAGMFRSRERGDGGWFARGPHVDGYEVLREFEGSKLVYTVIKSPERANIYELIWEMAIAGRSLQAIQLECSSRGFVTAPQRRDHLPKPFDVGRLNHTVRNPRYAGLVHHEGKIIGEGDWPRYVEPEDFHRLQADRTARNGSRRRPGRPVKGYLLDELAICGVCGGHLQTRTRHKPRADGSLTRRYACARHEGLYHPAAVEWCSAVPFDAVEVDRLVLSGIDALLKDAEALRDQIEAGRTAEIERLGAVVSSAREEAAKADATARKAQGRYERALADGDDDAAEIAMTAVKNIRAEASRARARLDAALDALQVDDQPDDRGVAARIWDALSGRVTDADGDIRKLNAALREWFAAFELRRDSDGALFALPVLSATAVQRLLLDPRGREEQSSKELRIEMPIARIGEVREALADGRLREIVTGPEALAVVKPALSSKNCQASAC